MLTFCTWFVLMLFYDILSIWFITVAMGSLIALDTKPYHYHICFKKPLKWFMVRIVKE